MECEKSYNTGLSLDLGLASYAPIKKNQKVHKPVACLDMSFELLLKQEADSVDSNAENDQSSLKRRSSSSDPENYDLHIHHINNTNKNGSRKKLRLTKEQSALLEDSFKLHSTLNTIQKQSLAEKLNLRPRQVEVWFQNRRARTKLKQTEADCEFLKEWCEKLSNENKRLKKELEELHGIKVGSSSSSSSSLCIQLPKAAAAAAATLRMCSSCEKLVNANIEGKCIDNGSIVCSLGCGPKQE